MKTKKTYRVIAEEKMYHDYYMDVVAENSDEAIKKALKETWKFQEYEDSCATSGLENFRAVKTGEKKNETS